MSTDTETDSMLDKGLVQYALGNLDAATAQWRAALERSPGNARALDYLRTVDGVDLPDPPAESEDEPATEAMAAITSEDMSAPEPPDNGSDALTPPFARKPSYDQEDDVQPEPVVPDVEISLRDARQAEADGKLEEALKHAEAAHKRDPEREDALSLVASLRDRLRSEYLERLRPLERVPVLRATDASILELSLDPIGGFLISQIDGEITIEELLTILGTFDEFRVLGSLNFLLDSGIIELR